MDDVIEKAIRAELQRQAESIYFWDPSDKDLFKEGQIEFAKFGDGTVRADRFDLKAVALALLDAIETPSEGMLKATGDGPNTNGRIWSAMIQQLRKEVSDVA